MSQGADSLKLRKACRLRTVNADGIYFDGSGTPDSFDVVFYAGRTSPGKVLSTCPQAPYSDPDGFGYVTIDCKATLTTHTKWVSVVANMAFSAGGEWGWLTNNTLRSKPAQWQNPGDGFGSGCTSWRDLVDCVGDAGQGPDFSYSLNQRAPDQVG